MIRPDVILPTTPYFFVGAPRIFLWYVGNLLSLGGKLATFEQSPQLALGS
jgi:hypothetical protein